MIVIDFSPPDHLVARLYPEPETKESIILIISFVKNHQDRRFRVILDLSKVLVPTIHSISLLINLREELKIEGRELLFCNVGYAARGILSLYNLDCQEKTCQENICG